MNEEPQWLDEEELEAFMSLMAVNIRLTAVLDAQLREDAGLSFFDYTVMSRLSEAPERRMRMRELAITANGSLSRLSQVVTRLEKKGWVCLLYTSPSPRDATLSRMPSSA